MNDSSALQPCRVLLAGAVHMDRTGWLAAPSAMGCSNPGRFDERPGGAAFNVASVVAALAGSASVLTRLGDDSAARVLRECAAARNVQLGASIAKDGKTGTYTSIIEPDGSLAIAVADMGIYDGFRVDAFAEYLTPLTSADWLGVDANLPESEIEKLAGQAKTRTAGFTVSKAKASKLRSVAGALDLIFTNRIEASALLSVEPLADSTAAANLLRDAGVTGAVISDGSRDVAVLDGGVITALPVPPLDRIVDVTGAGDALAGGTLVRLMSGDPPNSAVEFGIRAAQKTIETEGPWCADLAAQLSPAAAPRKQAP